MTPCHIQACKDSALYLVDGECGTIGWCQKHAKSFRITRDYDAQEKERENQ